MAFIKHLPCPNCGSKDNLAEYIDHYYCFGCSHWKSKNDIKSVRSRLQSQQAMLSDEISINVTDNIPTEAMQWLLQYGITKADVDSNHIGWCNDLQILVLVNTANYYQGRSFLTGVKYKSKGKKPLLWYGNGDILVCVEDVISAIKVSKANPNVTATPLLGSSIPLDLTETILERFKTVRVWLDRDKAIEAVKQARNIKQKGIDCEAIITPLDPKEYSTGEINEWLRNR